MTARAGRALLVLVAACGGASASSDASGPSCDPFETETTPTSLEHVVVAGRAADGTIYVVDEAEGAAFPQRLFVSEGDELREHAISGGGGHETMLELDGTDTPKVVLSRAASVPPDDHWDTIKVGDETLTPVPASDLARFAAIGVFTPSVVYDHAANGERILFVSRRDAAPGDYRVFFGTETAVRERIVRRIVSDAAAHVLRATFDVDGHDRTVEVPFDSALYGAEPRTAGVHFTCL